MKKLLISLGCSLLLLLAGCYLGDRVAPPRTVSLSFPAPAGQHRTSLSVSGPEAQEGLRIIDAVLTADGLTRDPNPPTANTPGFIASYTRYTGTGPRPVDNPTVCLNDDRLEVVFVEFWNHSGHLSAVTKRLCKSLRTELSNRYGTERVKVE